MTIHLPDNTTFNITPSDDSYRYAELTGDEYIELKFSTAVYTEIPTGSYVVFESKLYYLNRPQDVKIVHRRNFEYTVKFDTVAAVLKYRPFVNPDDGRVDFPVTGDLDEHVTLLVRSALAYTPFAWVKGNVLGGTAEKCISYNGLTMWEAIELMAEEFGTEFEFRGTTIDVCKVEYNEDAPLELQYGKYNGLTSGIPRSNYGDNPPVYGFVVKGSGQNINTSTNQQASYGDKTLHMPAYLIPPSMQNPDFKIPMIIGYDGEKFSYSVDMYETFLSDNYVYYEESGFNSNKASYYYIPLGGRMIYLCESPNVNPRQLVPMYGSKIDICDLSDIYPQLTHTITNITTRTVQDSNNEDYTEYSVYINSNINYEDALIPGNTMVIVFQSGMLTGKEFDVQYTHSQHKFTIVAKIIDDERMPEGVFIPAIGDTFRVFNCMLPDDYIRKDSDHTGAEWDMAREAVRQLWESQRNVYTWKFDIDGIYAAGLSSSEFEKIKIGGHVLFTDPSVQPSEVMIRIISIKQPVNHPKWINVTVADKPSVRRRARQQLSIQSYNEVARERNESNVATEVERRRSSVSTVSKGLTTLSGSVTTIAGRVTNVEKSVSDMHDNYNELKDSSEGIDVEGAVCAKMYNIVLSIDNSRRTFYIDSKFAGVETSVMITNSSSTDIEIIPVSKTDSVIFNMADKNNTLVSGGVCKLTFYYTNRLYYAYITNIISSVK